MKEHAPFKVVAVDMDGTFYNDDKQFDHEWFDRLLKKMRQEQIRFLPASGNQFYKLKQDFSPWQNELSYVAENGAILGQDGKIIRFHAPRRSLMQQLVAFLRQQAPNAGFLVSGVESAYTVKDFPDSYLKQERGPHYYYPHLKELNSFSELPLNDPLVKIAINLPEKRVQELIKDFTAKYGPGIYPTFSGNFAGDLMPQGISKATGLAEMLKMWDLSSKDLLVFGDGSNDIEMMDFAGTSYAMANASDEVKKHADHIAPSNNEMGVLQVLDEYLMQ